MKIVDERIPNSCLFGDLKLGEVFEYEDLFFLKSKIILCNHDQLLGGVRLVDGLWVDFNSANAVTKVDGVFTTK